MPRRALGSKLRLAVLCLAALSGTATAVAAGKPAKTRPAADVDGARLIAAASDPANWLTHGGTYSEERFSALAQINENNVENLGLAWVHETDSTIGTEATPLVIDGVMYTTTVWNVLVALDARSGKLLWRFDPAVDRSWIRVMCCGPANRGVAAWQGRIYLGTIDGRLIAVDAATGKQAWSVQTTDPSRPYSITGAPRVVKGRVIIGNGGAEYGVRGYVSAYDAATGEQAWRFWTVPGNPALGFENDTVAMIAKTWRGETWWQNGGGGTAWDAFAFDPKLNLLYIGTGNGGPWPRDLRSPGGGDNLFLCSIVAVDADSGAYRWHYQMVPGENWDYTCTQQMTLAELDLEGKRTPVIMQAPKNGFFYVLDRRDGKLLSAKNYVPVNWATHIDLVTGRPVENRELLYDQYRGQIIRPAHFGAHNWQPMSYSPLTGYVYLPAQDTSWFYARAAAYDHGEFTMNLGLHGALRPAANTPMPTNRGALIAWNPRTQREEWRVDHQGPWNGGTLVTAGNLVVQGAGDGHLAIYRADRGGRLWRKRIYTGAVAGPISYSVAGEQYIAVAAGWAGSMPIIGMPGTPVHRAPTRILAFKLGGKAQLPLPREQAFTIPASMKVSAATLERGQASYNSHCRICHGIDARSGGMMPDLRFMSAATHAEFEAIVLQGARAARGMPPFAERLKPEDVTAIHAWVIEQARIVGGKAGALP
jgi:quinohemoprotein ethanol dehydrogenase